MKRKILCILLALAIIVAMCPTIAMADLSPTVSVGSTEIEKKVDGSVSIDVSLSNNPGLISMALDITWDTSALELVSVTNTGDILTGWIGSPISGNTGAYRLPWQNDTASSDFTTNGRLCTLNFKILSGAAGTKSIGISANEIMNFEMEDLKESFTFNAGSITFTLPFSSIDIDTYTGKTYDGTAIANPTNDDLTIVGSKGEVTYTYYIDEGCTTETTTANGAASNGAAPKNAGDYWVKATVAADSTHDLATSAAKKFTIGRAAYSYTGPAATNTATVGDAMPTTDNTAEANGVGTEKVKGILTWYTDSERTMPSTGNFNTDGETTLYWKFTPASTETNYKENATTGKTTYTVSPLPLQEFTNANFTNDQNATYGGTFTAPTTTTAQGGEITYSSDNTNVAEVNSSTGAVTIKAAGVANITATAAATLSGGLNYAETSKSYKLTVDPKTLTKADLERDGSGDITKVYDGNDTATGVAVKVKSGVLVGSDSLSITGTAKFNSKNVTEANKVTFTPDAITTGNYALASTETVEITGASITARPITVTVNEARRAYLADNPTFTGTVTGGELATVDDYEGLGLTFTTTATNASNAGSYDVTKAGCANTNYNVTVNGTGKLIVDKIAPTSDDLDVNIPTSPIYNGEPKKATVTAKTGIVGLGTITVKYDGNSSAPIDVKTYAVTVDIAEGTNYTAVNGLSVGRFEIQKAALTLPSAAVTSKTYDGKDTAAITPGALAGVVATDAGKVAVEQTSVAGKFASVNVGSNIAVTASDEFTLTGKKAGNYTLTQPADLKGTINPCTSVTDQTQTGSAEDPLTVVKGVGTFPEAIFGGVNGETATGTVKYSYGSVSNETWDAVKEVLKSQAAGTTGTVSYTFTGTENYAGASASGSINFKIVDIAFYLEGTETIADAANAVTLADDKTYGKTWDELVTLKSMAAKVGSSPVEGEFRLDVTGTPDAGAQTYSVKFTGGSYTDITVFSGNITVEQREVVISWNNYENRVYNDGKTVTATITNKVGTDDVDLSVTGGDAINAGTGYTATAALTGADAANYKLPAEYTKTYSIAKAIPTGTPAYTKITQANRTLADAALVIGSLQPDAATYKLEWVGDDGVTPLGLDTVVEKNKAYKWLFTPADTANYETLTGTITPYYVAPAGGYFPVAEKPTINAGEGVKVTLSADGTVATITVEAGYDLADVVLNGVSKGKVTEVKGLKTGDKLVVTATKKAAEPTDPTDEAILATLADQKLVARSKVVTMKNGKKAVRITWYNQNGEMMEFDGIQIYRSVKRYTGYGKKPIFTSESGKYYNTAVKEGTKYYYRVRGFVVIDGQKYYTDYSLKAWRTVK